MHPRLATLGAALALAAPAAAHPAGPVPFQDHAPEIATDQDDAPEPAWLEFQGDPLSRLWASVGAETPPWSFMPDPRERARDPWTRWADALQALHGDAATRRGALSVLSGLALLDGRPGDAFAWVQGFGAGDPAALAGTLPRLFPGVPGRVPLGPGGRPAPMPDGALLRPQIPPIDAAVPGRIAPRRATCRGLVVGDATFDMLLKVDGSGVVAEFTHVAGGAGDLRLQLPAPAGYRLKSLYLDWEQQPPPGGADPKAFDWSGTAVTVPLRPRAEGAEDPGYAESFSVFARLDRNETALPKSPAAGSALPESAVEAGLELVVPPAPVGGGGEPWEAIAAAWARAAGVPTTVVPAAAARVRQTSGAQTGGMRGITVRFHEAPDPAALRRRITGAIEARCRAEG